MTDKEVQDSFNIPWTAFWKKYGNNPPKDEAEEWKAFCDESERLKKDYPLLEEVINRLTTEIIERARGRGRMPGDFHRPPR